MLGRRSVLLCAASLMSLTACAPAETPRDAAAPPDAPPPALSAQNVACPGAASIAAEIHVVQNMAFMPDTVTIRANGIVKFVHPPLAGSPEFHNIATTSMMYAVEDGKTGCVRYNTPGRYEYYCKNHGFTGTIIVQ